MGDALSDVKATGRGDDDIDGGPGNDEAVGDALSGTYKRDRSDPPGSARATAGGLQTQVRAVGFGKDVINGLLGTDLVVGDAAVHGVGTAMCGGNDRLNGETNARKGPNVSGLGKRIELIIGDCLATGGDALGASKDRKINGGGDNDVLVGDNFASGLAQGSGSDPNMLGGTGNDKVFGDHFDKSGSRSGGGKDNARGGAGSDKLEGGPKKDKCSGGPGKDKAVTKGTHKCEKTTSVP